MCLKIVRLSVCYQQGVEIMKKTLVSILLVIVFLFSGTMAIAATPTDDLKPVMADLVGILTDENLKGDDHLVERRAKIMLNIKRGFNFREMSKRILGKTWRKIDETERDTFTKLMTKLLENVYIGKLEGYSESAVEYVAETVKGKRAQVTTLIENNGVKLPVHYIMHQTQSRWMVYDINIEGVSLVRNYQQQFKSILRKEKYEGLKKVIDEKNQTFSQKVNK